MRLLVYSLMRLVLLVAAVVVLHVLGLRSWLLWLVAVVVAALVSYVLLPRLRDAAARQVADSVRRRPRRRSRAERRDEDADYEDGLLDSAVPDGAGHAGATDPGATRREDGGHEGAGPASRGSDRDARH